MMFGFLLTSRLEHTKLLCSLNGTTFHSLSLRL